MTRYRFFLASLLVWLAVLFNLERVHEPINIASFVYVFAGLLAAAVVVLPPMRKATLGGLATLSVLLLVMLKILLGYEVAGAGLSLTVTEASAILITVALAHQIARHARRFEISAAELAAIRWQAHPKSFDDAQAEMYQELRRARNFDRRVSIVALEPTSDSVTLSIDSMVKEVRREMVQRYVQARLTDCLQKEVQDFDLVTSINGRFLLVLPERSSEQADEVTRRLAERVQNELGLRLRIGTAAFPDDEVTLTGLVERAEAAMSAPTLLHVDDLRPGIAEPFADMHPSLVGVE
ncbi:MAG: hypothetical protein OES79_11560 [Planctomycetota bacterium]|nr:hypothetical protein [Planctomycetota bacterium]